MARFLMVTIVLASALVGVAQAQQVTRQPAPRTTRSYRSYSVTPAPRGDVRRDSPHASEATWRHASSKPAGHYGGGR